MKVVAQMSLLPCLAVGCAEDRPSYCEEKIECEHGTRDDLDVCVDSMESERETAENCGCSALCDEWFDCVIETGTCETAGWNLGEDVDGGVSWEPDPDGPGEWVTDPSCTEISRTVFGCETDAGMDPDHGGECGG